jgi:hypothetical protein
MNTIGGFTVTGAKDFRLATTGAGGVLVLNNYLDGGHYSVVSGGRIVQAAGTRIVADSLSVASLLYPVPPPATPADAYTVSLLNPGNQIRNATANYEGGQFVGSYAIYDGLQDKTYYGQAFPIVNELIASFAVPDAGTRIPTPTPTGKVTTEGEEMDRLGVVSRSSELDQPRSARRAAGSAQGKAKAGAKE